MTNTQPETRSLYLSQFWHSLILWKLPFKVISKFCHLSHGFFNNKQNLEKTMFLNNKSSCFFPWHVQCGSQSTDIFENYLLPVTLGWGGERTRVDTRVSPPQVSGPDWDQWVEQWWPWYRLVPAPGTWSTTDHHYDVMPALRCLSWVGWSLEMRVTLLHMV